VRWITPSDGDPDVITEQRTSKASDDEPLGPLSTVEAGESAAYFGRQREGAYWQMYRITRSKRDRSSRGMRPRSRRHPRNLAFGLASSLPSSNASQSLALRRCGLVGVRSPIQPAIRERWFSIVLPTTSRVASSDRYMERNGSILALRRRSSTRSFASSVSAPNSLYFPPSSLIGLSGRSRPLAEARPG
jgi:hypothetical protein